MKTVIVLSILFCAIALPALGELTDADLDKIRLIVKEEVKTEITGVRQEIAGVKQELKAEIAGVAEIATETESGDCWLRETDKRLYRRQNRGCRQTFINIQLGDLCPNASYCRYDRYTHSHHGVAERKGSRTRENKSRTQTGNRST
jgi:hypothetical protein